MYCSGHQDSTFKPAVVADTEAGVPVAAICRHPITFEGHVLCSACSDSRQRCAYCGKAA